MTIPSLIRKFVCLVLAIALAIVGIIIYQSLNIYAASDNYYNSLKKYDPVSETSAAIAGEITTRPDVSKPKTVINNSIKELQDDYSDVLGWVNIDNTNIDQVFVQGDDDKYYLHRNLDGEYLFAGTCYLTSMNSSELNDFNNIIYGHNMKNDTMFSNITLFSDEDYFDEHQSGSIRTPYENIRLDIFAYCVVDYNDNNIYRVATRQDGDAQKYLDYIKENARHLRDVDVTESDSIMILSTCSYEYDGARGILVAKMVKE